MRSISNEEEVNQLGAFKFKFGECWEANMGGISNKEEVNQLRGLQIQVW